jgi:hypothetical protein
MHTNTYTHTHTHTHSHTHSHAHSHTRSHTRSLTRSHTHSHTHSHTLYRAQVSELEELLAKAEADISALQAEVPCDHVTMWLPC